MNSYEIGAKVTVKGRFGVNPTALLAESLANTTSITVANTTGYATGDLVIVNPGAPNEEVNTLATITGRVFGMASAWVHPHHIRERLWERADPTVTTLKVRDPSGATTSYASGTISSADGVGMFEHNVSTTGAGIYYYRWRGSGIAESAGEGQFNVRPSQFAS